MAINCIFPTSPFYEKTGISHQALITNDATARLLVNQSFHIPQILQRRFLARFPEAGFIKIQRKISEYL